MNSEDIGYYRKRAARERELALATDDRDIAKIHLELAHKYEALSEQTEPRATLSIGWGSMSRA